MLAISSDSIIVETSCSRMLSIGVSVVVVVSVKLRMAVYTSAHTLAGQRYTTMSETFDLLLTKLV